MIDVALLLGVFAGLMAVGLRLWRTLSGPAAGRRRLIARAAVLVALIAPAHLLAAWRLMNHQGFQLVGPLISRVETSARVVALTIDDGPGHAVWEVVRVLDELAVPATFFVNGRALAADLGPARVLVAAGHELGNHTFSHRRMIFRSQQFIRDEIEQTDDLIRDAGHQGPILFRPPHGKKLLALPYYLVRTSRTTVMADVQPDNRPRDAAATVAFVLERTRPGSIVLLHALGVRASRTALPGIVWGLRSRGYRFVTVSELLANGPSPTGPVPPGS